MPNEMQFKVRCGDWSGLMDWLEKDPSLQNRVQVDIERPVEERGGNVAASMLPYLQIMFEVGLATVVTQAIARFHARKGTGLPTVIRHGDTEIELHGNEGPDEIAQLVDRLRQDPGDTEGNNS